MNKVDKTNLFAISRFECIYKYNEVYWEYNENIWSGIIYMQKSKYTITNRFCQVVVAVFKPPAQRKILVFLKLYMKPSLILCYLFSLDLLVFSNFVILHSNLNIANKFVRPFLFTLLNNSLYHMQYAYRIRAYTTLAAYKKWGF